MTSTDEFKNKKNDSNLIIQIENKLKTLGILKPPQNIFPSIYEYQYLCEAILLVITDEQFKNACDNTIYTVIAKKHGREWLSTTKRVEIGINAEIQGGWVWNEEYADAWKTYFGFSNLDEAVCPNNLRFIATIAELLRSNLQ